MNRTKKYEGLCAEGKPPPTEVPIGWQRRITHSGVVYISPSGSVLVCLEQVKSYLLTDGTCKCGLECPLVIQKIFNFDPGAVVKQRTAEDVRADVDVTKLCIHKRKIIAVATLHRSMESPQTSLALSSHSGGLSTMPMVPLSHQALRNNMHDGPPKSVSLDAKNPYKMGMVVSCQRYYNHEMGSPTQRDLYNNRTRLRASDHSSQQRSPYCSRSVLLSPSSSTTCGAQNYGDETLSPRTEPLGSPEPNMLGFHRVCSPGSAHMNGDHFTPLSPPNILLHGSTSTTQLSCTMARRSNRPGSPIVDEKSPVMNPTYSFQRNDFPHKPQPACLPQSHHSLSLLPSCVLQKKQVTSEKDPLGILDPIPSMGQSQVPLLPNSGLQHNAQSPVPPMNVNIPPTSVPLPSNLPLPTGKPGPVGHGQRVHHHHTPSSVSSSPIMSPVHIAGPGLARVEESPHRSRCSSGSSEHGSFAHPLGLQVPCGSSKPFPRSPRASIGSPRPAMQPSSAFKMDKLHHLNDAPNHLSGGMNSMISRHPNSMCLPGSGSDGVLQRNHSVGMPLNNILDQQNPASFPASSLLSAAAKAQLVNQNKHPDSTAGAGTEAHIGCSLGHPGLVGGGGNVEGHSTLNQRYLPNPGPLVSEGQSGRAALRDKLMGMAQQREANRKRKLSNDGNAGGINNDRAFDVLKHPLGGSGSGCSSSNFPEPLRRMLQKGGLPQNTSMAQLLQSMSHQSACNGPNHIGNPGKSAFLDERLPQLTTLQQNVQGLQVQSRAEVSGFQNMNIDGQNSNMEPFIVPMNQIQEPDLAGNFGVLGYGGQHATIGSMHGNLNPHQQQFGHYQKPSQGNPHFRGRPGLPSIISNGSVKTVSELDAVNSSLSCELRQAQEESLQSLIRNSQTLQQQRLQQQPLVQGQHPSLGRLSIQGQHQGTAPGLGRLSIQGQHQGTAPVLGRLSIQGQHQGISPGLGRLSIQGQQQGTAPGLGRLSIHRFHPDASLPDGSSSNPMNSLLESFQVSLPERIPLPNRTIIRQPEMMSHPNAPCHQEGHGEYQAAQGLRNVLGEVLTPIQKKEMGSASKGRFNVITSSGGNGALTSSVVGQPVNPVIHGPLHLYQEPVPELRHHPKVGRPRKKTPDPVAMEVPTRFRSPRRGAQRRQWNGDTEGQEQAGLWGNDVLHQQLSLAPSRNSTYPERPKGLFQLAPPNQTPLQFPSNMYAHINGSSGGFNSGGLHARHLNLAPCSSSGPPECHVTKDYNHLNMHLNGNFKGHLNGHHYNGHYNGSLSSEENLSSGDVSFSDGPQLHHRPRTQAPYPRELLWGQGKGVLSWPGKMGSQGHLYSPGMLNGMQGKVESEKFQRTLTEDLETLQKANKITRNGGKQNNHLEAAIQEAMSELDKMTGNMSQRERQVKTPKLKRRKISR